MRAVGLICALSVVAVAAAHAASAAQRPAGVIPGIAWLTLVDPAKGCVDVDPGPTGAVRCAMSGRYHYTPGWTASYSWTWKLPQDADNLVAALGDEAGTLVLRIAGRGTMRLTLRGKKQVAVTTGTWTYRSGTRQFARRRGSGRYQLYTLPGSDGLEARLILFGRLR